MFKRFLQGTVLLSVVAFPVAPVFADTTGALTALAGLPATSVSPACKTPNTEAMAIDQVSPDYPKSAQDFGFGNVTVLVKITVGPTGKLEAASIYNGSGNADIDRNALSAAQESRYSPKIVGCEATSATYLFRADFIAN